MFTCVSKSEFTYPISPTVGRVFTQQKVHKQQVGPRNSIYNWINRHPPWWWGGFGWSSPERSWTIVAKPFELRLLRWINWHEHSCLSLLYSQRTLGNRTSSKRDVKNLLEQKFKLFWIVVFFVGRCWMFFCFFVGVVFEEGRVCMGWFFPQKPWQSWPESPTKAPPRITSAVLV